MVTVNEGTMALLAELEQPSPAEVLSQASAPRPPGGRG